MNTIQVEAISNLERKITVQVPWDDVSKELDDAYRGLQRRARIKGFRPGKAPRKVLEQMYRRAVEEEVVGRLVDEGFRKAVDEHDLFPIDRPNLEAMPDVKKGEPLQFIATVEVKPEVEPKVWEGLEVERKVLEVSEEEVNQELETLREKATVVEQIEDRDDAQSGDLAVIDFFGYVDGETFKGGKGINYTLELGTNRMIPGFEDQVIGMKVGDEKTFDLNFPEGEGPDEVEGKDVEWKIELKELKRKILPELDDEFAKDLGEYDTLEELKAGVKQNLATREDAKSKRNLKNAVVDALVEKNEVEVPERMIDRQVEIMMQDTMRYVQNVNDPRITEVLEKLKVEARPNAEKQVKSTLLLEGVARLESLEVSDEEVEGRLQELAREHRMPVQQVRKQLDDNDQLDSVRYNLLQDKAMDLVIERASVTERTVSAEEMASDEEMGGTEEAEAED